MKQITFAMIKPHIFKNPVAVDRIMATVNEQFKVLQTKEIKMDKDVATKFYAEHLGKFYFDRLQQLMCSGPALALVLEANDSIQKWREIIGPTRVYQGVYSSPTSIRSLYGISDTRNVCHGADSPLSVKREISILFPEFKYENHMGE